MKCFLLHVYNILKTFHHALVKDMFHRRVPFTFLGFMLKQDPVPTTQKTGWTIHSSFPVLFGLEKGFILDVITRGGVNKHFPVYWAIFGFVTNEQTNNLVILV